MSRISRIGRVVAGFVVAAVAFTGGPRAASAEPVSPPAWTTPFPGGSMAPVKPVWTPPAVPATWPAPGTLAPSPWTMSKPERTTPSPRLTPPSGGGTGGLVMPMPSPPPLGTMPWQSGTGSGGFTPPAPSAPSVASLTRRDPFADLFPDPSFQPGRFPPSKPSVVSPPLVKPSLVFFDYTRYAEERRKLAGDKSFPYLGTDFEVLGPSTGHVDQAPKGTVVYNCIAWTLGITSRWVWPAKPKMKATVKDFDELYGRAGYKRLDIRDTRFVPGQEKIMLYGKVGSSGAVNPTHGSRQETDGTWSSKLGGLALIKHRTPEAVAGPSYGDPIAVYARKAKTQATR